MSTREYVENCRVRACEEYFEILNPGVVVVANKTPMLRKLKKRTLYCSRCGKKTYIQSEYSCTMVAGGGIKKMMQYHAVFLPALLVLLCKLKYVKTIVWA